MNQAKRDIMILELSLASLTSSTDGDVITRIEQGVSLDIRVKTMDSFIIGDTSWPGVSRDLPPYLFSGPYILLQRI